MMARLHALFVTFLLLVAISTVQSDDILAHDAGECTFYIGCNYTVSVKPSNTCHSNSEKVSRQKRSLNPVTGSSNGGASQTDVLSRLNRLQHKLTKEMRNLSARVLRGIRRMESDIMEITGKQKHGHFKDPSSQCPPGFVTLDNWSHCYLFSTFNTTWYEARDFCEAMDSNVVALGSLREHYVVIFLIKNNPAYRDAEGWWTSGTYVTKTKQWMWTSNVETKPFTFIKWAVNEPNDTSQSDLQCVMLFRGDDHQWHDQLCTERYNFVCEAPLRKA